MDKDYEMCEMCGMRAATFFIKKNINGVVTEKHLCAHCAEKLQKSDAFNEIFDGVNLFSGLFDEQPTMTKMRVCKCGTTEKDVIDNMKFGCSECYNTFRDIAKKFVGKLGGNTYVGKPELVHELKEEQKPLDEQQLLRQQIKDAVDKEDFLLANELKEKLSKL
ncbi:MAG: hypothetical protein RR348_05005, partial [Clostridia bacterium]